MSQISYEFHEWKKGDLISALKLNEMEDGIRDALTKLGRLEDSPNYGIVDNATDTTKTIDNCTGYDASQNKLVSARAVLKAINHLDYADPNASATGFVDGVTQVDGQIAVTHTPFNTQVLWQNNPNDHRAELGINIAGNHSDNGTKQKVPVATTDVLTPPAQEGDEASYAVGEYGVVQLCTETTMSDNLNNVTTAATPKGVWNAINTLDITQITNTNGKTIATIDEANGIVSATFQDINIVSSQITDRADGTGNEHIANTVVKTNSSGIIPSQLLPSYVDDVLVFDTYDDFPWNSPSALAQLQELRQMWMAISNGDPKPESPTDFNPDDSHTTALPETGKIYIAADTGRTYRWYDDDEGNFGYALIGIAHLDYADSEAAATKFVSSITQTDGQIAAVHTLFSPVMTWTAAAAGTNDDKPTLSITVAGNTSAAVTPNIATTSVYGVTKLSSATDGTSEVLAATPKAVSDALTAAKGYTDTSIAALDVSSISGFAANKTLATLTETDGKIAATFQDIKIANTDVSGLGTASVKDVPTTGNASQTEVVMGNDTRLTDARNAADVSAWAKESTKPSYSVSEISGAAAATDPSFTLTASTGEITFTDGIDTVTFTLADLQALKASLT